MKTGDDSDEDYIPEPEPEVEPELEPTNNGISVVKSGGGDTKYTYPLISITKEIDGVTKEIGIKIIFTKVAFGTSVWLTELLVDGDVIKESRSEEAFVVSEKAQTDIQNFITNFLEMGQLQAEEITSELISEGKKHEIDILLMDERNERLVKKQQKDIASKEVITVRVKYKESDVQFDTSINMSNGYWNTVLTVDGNAMHPVYHHSILAEIDEDRDDSAFVPNMKVLLHSTKQACKVLMVDVVNEALKSAARFEAIKKIYSEKAESDRLAKIERESERLQKASENRVVPMLQGCFLPDGYEIVSNGTYGVCGAILLISYDAQGKEIRKKLCDSQVMVTGYLKNYDSGIDLIEIMFTAPDTNNKVSETRTVWVSVESIANKEVFKREILPKGLIVTPKNHDAVMEYLSACINTNFGNTDVNCAFHSGFVFEHNGWKDSECTKYVSGERFFTIEGTTVTEGKCTYIDTENTEAVRKLSTIGSPEEWGKLVSPVIKYPRVRFAFYKAFDVIISEMLGVDNCTIGFTWKSSSGKTLTPMILASGYGNPNRKTGLLITGDISVTALYANLRAYVGHPLFVDDTVNMKEETKKVIGYIAANGQEPERGQKSGKRRGQTPINSSVFISSEIDILSERAQDGAGNRSIIVNKPLMPELDQKLIRDIKNGLILNYGHILKLFLQKVALHRDELREWFEEAVTRLQATTADLGKKRQAELYAIAEVSGRLVEEIFAEMGLKVRKPAKIVNFMWKECVLNKVKDSLALEALACVYNYYLLHLFNFVSDDSIPSGPIIDGWDIKKDNYIDWNPNTIAKILKDNGFDKNSVLRDWKAAKIIDANKKGFGKSTDHFLKPGGEKFSMAFIRIMKEKVYEFLPEIEDPHAAEKKEIDKYLDQIRDDVAKGRNPSDILKPRDPLKQQYEPKIMPKPQPVKSFADLQITAVHPERTQEKPKEPEPVEGSGNDW